MKCITAESAQKLSDLQLISLRKTECKSCAMAINVEIGRREICEPFCVPYGVLFGTEEMNDRDTKIPRGKGQFVSMPKPKVITSRALSFLVEGEEGRMGKTVFKNIDSDTLHDILDSCEKVTITRVHVK